MASETSETPSASRYVVGIDLGTTNSALAYVDTQSSSTDVRDFPIAQLVAPGTVETRDTLPSFHYEPATGELPPHALKLPWGEPEAGYAVGIWAREHGGEVPSRLVQSAKSWLCHSGVDRLAELLPWHAAPDATRLSPVEASARYLAHLRGAWNQAHADAPLEQQDVVLTLPASFDEVARELTVKAAARAGLPRVVLIEEPQAAFYAWLATQGDQWQPVVEAGQKILICDIGGGTSDFTLLRVRRQSDGKLQFHRVAVGEHLLLGGDNLDLALAHHIERRLGGDGKLEPRAWGMLVQASRRAKETLLSAGAPETLTVNIRSGGSRLIGGSRQVELTCDEVEQLIFEGFLPQVELNAQPVARRSGFQEFGLPYAPDAAMTRYLAAFLSAHRHAGDGPGATATDVDPARPAIVLFNGGFFASPALQRRLLDVLGSWFNRPGQPHWEPAVLENRRLDLAVARGAAYYGLVRRGVGVRIAAGLARSYYIGLADAAGRQSAMCVAPAGVEEGQTVELAAQRFRLVTGAPVEFPLFVSSTRLTDSPGVLCEIDPLQMTPLPPIRTVLQADKSRGAAAGAIEVTLESQLTEIGTLELWCREVDGPRRWRLQFDVRAATQTDRTGHTGAGEQQGLVEQSAIDTCHAIVARTFGGEASTTGETIPPESVVKRLAEALDMSRADWPPSLLRALWSLVFDGEAGRRRGAQHESRWLHLLGFALRPGYGMALDDWRVGRTYKLLQQKLAFPSAQGRAEWWILWRRLAGGLLAGQQRALAEPVVAELRAAVRARQRGRSIDYRPAPHEGAECWRALGSFELLDAGWKEELGEIALQLAKHEKQPVLRQAQVWALGRLGARQPVYGPLNCTLAPDVVERWIGALVDLRSPPDSLPLALMQLARKTDDRYRDVSPSARDRAANALTELNAPAHFIELVRHGGQLAEAEQGLVFGEALPHGLQLVGG
ncbi:MAG: Hsp70 family protein [Planctomycetes bacterium]|nr:Hsp70 family protein [Planctomycetota bacterium]